MGTGGEKYHKITFLLYIHARYILFWRQALWLIHFSANLIFCDAVLGTNVLIIKIVSYSYNLKCGIVSQKNAEVQYPQHNGLVCTYAYPQLCIIHVHPYPDWSKHMSKSWESAHANDDSPYIIWYTYIHHAGITIDSPICVWCEHHEPTQFCGRSLRPPIASPSGLSGHHLSYPHFWPSRVS